MAAEPEPLPFAVQGSLTAFRWSSYDVPFWARPNRRSGRWHRVGDEPTQCWSLSPQAAWAELIRAEGLRSEAEIDEVRMPLWVCRVPIVGLVDLRDVSEQGRHGIGSEELISQDWAACQAAGRALRTTYRGVVSPSAALEGHANLTLFGGRRAIDWASRPTLASTVPATVTAIGRPPAGLVGQVRHPAHDNDPPPLF